MKKTDMKNVKVIYDADNTVVFVLDLLYACELLMRKASEGN